MRPLPTNPTVQDLLDAQRSIMSTRSLDRTSAPGRDGLLFDALRRHVRPGVVIQRRVAVDTPGGKLVSPIVISNTARRIAILPTEDADPHPGRTAAVLLVFGPFDAVYRVSEHALKYRVTAVAWQIARHEARLFDDPARRTLMLCASSIGRTARASDRPAASHLARVPSPDVTSMRLNRPAEWSASFEEAMRVIEARQVPLFARSA